MKFLIVIISIIFALQSVHSQYFTDEIKENIFLGDFITAKNIISQKLETPETTKKEKAQLYHIKGDMAKISGDMDSALKDWQKAAEIRNQLYPNKEDYHHAWKYAHLSNYHYEKINKLFAKKFADSCLSLIKDLSLEQQKEIEIHRIWNILGQSNKLQATKKLDVYEYNYDKTFLFYQKSIDFQLSNKTSKHNLAKTYHLIGNAYLDMAVFYNKIGEKPKFKISKNKSVLYHDKAIFIWNKLYGEQHYELGKTLFVKGLLFHYLTDKKKAIDLFYQALTAYGIDVSNMELSELKLIPNKEVLLMCLKYYTIDLLYLDSFHKDAAIYLEEAEKTNLLAIKLWEEIHNLSKNNNTNQNLAIYTLVPHQERIAILLRKKENEGLQNTEEEFFLANQKMKYFDLYKNKETELTKINISKIQNKLKPNQLFIDLHVSRSNQTIYLLNITSSTFKIQNVSFELKKTALDFLSSIIQRNYEVYTQSSYKLYENIFPEGLEDKTELIICPDGIFSSIPFEAMLCSKKNIKNKDYRELDYLIKKAKIQYVLSPMMFMRKTQQNDWDLAVFAPTYEDYQFTELPFSKKLAKELTDKFDAVDYIGEKATKSNFKKINNALVHLSTHSVINDEVTNNLILFSDEPIYQSELNFINNIPKTIVINSCNSGVGKQLVGDGINGIVREFHRLGVSSTISNLWEVDDKASNNLFLSTYSKLYEESSLIDALWKAKLEHIKNASNSELAAPYYWAGHKMVGGNVIFEKREKLISESNWIWFLACLISAVLLVYLVFRKKIN